MQRLIAKITLAASYSTSDLPRCRRRAISTSSKLWTRRSGVLPHQLLPPGAQITVLAGNPMTAGPYTIRLKFPAHYAIPAHSHPTDENLVVVSGALTFGMGDASMDKTLLPGGFALMHASMNHFAYTSRSAKPRSCCMGTAPSSSSTSIQPTIRAPPKELGNSAAMNFPCHQVLNI